MANDIVADGIILKGIDGFYYVETDSGIHECRARGVFRKKGMKPLAGDRVKVILSEINGNVVDSIYERTSMFSRPPVANINKLFIISSVLEPSPNFLVIDRMTALACNKGIEPVVVFSKSDLANPDEYIAIYNKAGIEAFAVSCVTGEGIERIKSALKGHISAFTGNTGVGKSSILNAVFPHLELETGEISQKLGRGRHTTRQSELIKLEDGYVADTPGFSSLEFEGDDLMLKENVAFGFKEFLPYLGTCKFSTCLHVKDKGCKILEAVDEGKISSSRHESYVAMVESARRLNEWELK